MPQRRNEFAFVSDGASQRWRLTQYGDRLRRDTEEWEGQLGMKHAIRPAGAAAVMVGLLAVGVGVAGPASAQAFHTSYMTKAFTPWLSTTSQGPQYWTVSKGTTVSMKCWNTGKSVDGTAKWFWIESSAYPFTQGYVPANDVGNQWLSSPHC